MKKIKERKTSKKIIIMIVIVMLFNFVMPNYSFALSGGGGALFKYITPIILMVPDLLLNKLQNIFIGEDEKGEYIDIAQLDPEDGVSHYLIMYSPGVIFSGQAAGLDVNFISHMGDENGKVKKTWYKYEYEEVDDDLNYEDLVNGDYGFDPAGTVDKVSNSDAETYMFWFGKTVRSVIWKGPKKETKEFEQEWDPEEFIENPDDDAVKNYKSKLVTSNAYGYILNYVQQLGYTEDNKISEQLINTKNEEYVGSNHILKTAIFKWEKNHEVVVCRADVSVNHESDVLSKCKIKYKCEGNLPDFQQDYWYHMSTEEHLPILGYLIGGTAIVIGVIGAPFTGGSSLTVSAWGVAGIAGYGATDYLTGELSKALTGGTLYKVWISDHTATSVSIAYTLRNSVASYYKAFQEVALVVLLCALVYVAIRMIISTASSDKAKYKKMLFDCISAICLLYLLHFFINIVLTVIQSINDVFASTVIKNGKDVLMSDLRTRIGNDPENEDLSLYFVDIVMYVTLVIYTIQFTIVYLKRVINMAFLTIIAPMVAFTYPIDKIKDGKAQALGTWLKEFSFNALMQPIHMILYWLFVGSAIGFATQNPIYAIVMIGFLRPGEKFVRQLFGLESQSSLGNMTSALGGAALMNGMKKLGKNFPKPKGGSEGKGQEGESQGSGRVRTTNSNIGGSDPYAALRGGNNGGSQQAGNGGQPVGSPPRTNNAPTPSQTTATSPASPAGNGGQAGGSSPRTNNAPTATPAQTATAKTGGRWTRTKGAWNVAKKYAPKVLGRGLGRGAIKIAGAATLGTIGLAAGLTTGDASKAIAGLTGGMVAGKSLAGNLAKGVGNLGRGANGIRRGIVDTFREGAYGKGEAERIRFTKSAEYKKLIKDHPEQAAVARELTEAGIRDTNKMGIALEGIREGRYSAGEAAAYMRMAEAKDCPDEVLYSKSKFEEYLKARGIPTANAEKIRKGIVEFK